MADARGTPNEVRPPELTWQMLADSLLATASADKSRDDGNTSEPAVCSEAAEAALTWQQLADSLPPGSPGDFDLDSDEELPGGSLPSSFPYSPSEGGQLAEQQQEQQPDQQPPLLPLVVSDAQMRGLLADTVPITSHLLQAVTATLDSASRSEVAPASSLDKLASKLLEDKSFRVRICLEDLAEQTCRSRQTLPQEIRLVASCAMECDLYHRRKLEQQITNCF